MSNLQNGYVREPDMKKLLLPLLLFATAYTASAQSIELNADYLREPQSDIVVSIGSSAGDKFSDFFNYHVSTVWDEKTKLCKVTFGRVEYEASEKSITPEPSTEHRNKFLPGKAILMKIDLDGGYDPSVDGVYDLAEEIIPAMLKAPMGPEAASTLHGFPQKILINSLVRDLQTILGAIRLGPFFGQIVELDKTSVLRQLPGLNVTVTTKKLGDVYELKGIMSAPNVTGGSMQSGEMFLRMSASNFRLLLETKVPEKEFTTIVRTENRGR